MDPQSPEKDLAAQAARLTVWSAKRAAAFQAHWENLPESVRHQMVWPAVLLSRPSVLMGLAEMGVGLTRFSTPDWKSLPRVLQNHFRAFQTPGVMEGDQLRKFVFYKNSPLKVHQALTRGGVPSGEENLFDGRWLLESLGRGWQNSFEYALWQAPDRLKEHAESPTPVLFSGALTGWFDNQSSASQAIFKRVLVLGGSPAFAIARQITVQRFPAHLDKLESLLAEARELALNESLPCSPASPRRGPRF